MKLIIFSYPSVDEYLVLKLKHNRLVLKLNHNKFGDTIFQVLMISSHDNLLRYQQKNKKNKKINKYKSTESFQLNIKIKCMEE